jgi:antitoxin component HigA of HigAB toxin-antitoxin module
VGSNVYAAKRKSIVYNASGVASQRMPTSPALILWRVESLLLRHCYPIRAISALEALAELMAANNLKQKDLAPLFGSESMVSEVLHGKRELNKQHIEKLSQRFKVSPALFF